MSGWYRIDLWFRDHILEKLITKLNKPVSKVNDQTIGERIFEHSLYDE